ncbi:MAG: Piwi domain-containing protein [Opitutaceae bacterium]|jgi:hypothetical protein
MVYNLHLNFLPTQGTIPSFEIHRRPRKDDEKIPQGKELIGCKLPVDGSQNPEWKPFVVSFTSRNGFQPFPIAASTSIHLTRRAFVEGLVARCTELGPKFAWRANTDGFLSEVVFPIAMHSEGEEEIVLQPYFLAATNQFGFLVDFHFRLRDGIPFSRKVQQLSLSLDEKFRRNLDYYADRLAKIDGFISGRWNQLIPLVLPGSKAPLVFATDFTALPSQRLKPKTYIVGTGANQREHKSQFIGIKEFGPWQPITRCPPLLFVFRNQEIEYARRLARALRGREPGISFAGFDKIFRVPLEISANPVVVTDFTRAEMERALAQATGPNGPTHIPVLVMPKAADAYAIHKAVFTHAGVPTQVCTTEVLADDYALQWSVANIALQIFCKAGGQPWKVKPTDDRALIIGLSQSHKIVVNETRRIEKYFAFSILTDSSGLFQSINVMGEGPDQRSYLDQLRQNLQNLLKDKAATFSKVVLHTSFKLKFAEMQVIQDVVRDTAKSSSHCSFAVVKVNQRNRFFAVNRSVNSLVPYEASYLSLGHSEYLLWFEGIFPDNQSVKKVIPGPTHLSFLKVSEGQLIGDEQILQDLVNLSGANWRGFNAKSAPVSVFFCHLVADLLHEFQQRDLPLPQLNALKPWFL